MPVTPEASDPKPADAMETPGASTTEGDDRGRFGYGRPAHGSEPGAHFTFGEQQEREPRMSDRREIYRSSNGDCWFLVRDPKSDYGMVFHQPNPSSGGIPSFIPIGDFLRPGSDGPEHRALLWLIGKLAKEPSDTTP